MKLTANKTYVSLLLLSAILQVLSGNFPTEFFAFPMDILVALLWMALIWYGFKEYSKNPVVAMLASASSTWWSIGWFTAGCLVIALFPQLSPADAASREGVFAALGCYNFMSSWIFVAGLALLLTNLGFVTVRRAFRPGRNRWRFVLNHAGLWIALFAGFIGSASEQTLRMQVFRERPNNEAYAENGATVYLDKPLQLSDLKTEHYANGVPRSFVAEVLLGGKPVRLEVNAPYNERWGEDYYLASYDTRSASPRYCIVQIVREPAKYFMLAGIIMMLCGGFLLFLNGPGQESGITAALPAKQNACRKDDKSTGG